MSTIHRTRTLVTLGAAALGLALAQPAFAGSDPNKAVETAAAAAAKGELPETKRICLQDEVTGSRIPRKVCDTLKGWKARGIDPFAKAK